jgi:hypothetical protein
MCGRVTDTEHGCSTWLLFVSCLNCETTVRKEYDYFLMVSLYDFHAKGRNIKSIPATNAKNGLILVLNTLAKKPMRKIKP